MNIPLGIRAKPRKGAIERETENKRIARRYIQNTRVSLFSFSRSFENRPQLCLCSTSSNRLCINIKLQHDSMMNGKNGCSKLMLDMALYCAPEMFHSRNVKALSSHQPFSLIYVEYGEWAKRLMKSRCTIRPKSIIYVLRTVYRICLNTN